MTYDDERGLRLSGDFEYTLEPAGEDVARAVADDDVVIYFADAGPNGYNCAKVVVPFYWVSAYRVAAI